MVEQVGGNFTECGFTGLDASAASLATEETGHSPWVVRGKGLLVDWFENSDVTFGILNDVGTAGSISGELGLHILVEAFSAL